MALGNNKEIELSHMLTRDQRLIVNQSLIGFEAIDCSLISLFFRIPINDQLKIPLLGRNLFVNFDDPRSKRNNQDMNCTTFIFLGFNLQEIFKF